MTLADDVRRKEELLDAIQLAIILAYQRVFHREAPAWPQALAELERAAEAAMSGPAEDDPPERVAAFAPPAAEWERWEALE